MKDDFVPCSSYLVLLMVISPLIQTDLPGVKHLQPEGWSDIMPSIEFYVRTPFCYPLKVLKDGALVGIGTAIVLGETAWLAHIIVHPESRSQGIGGLITEALVTLLRGYNCSTLFLIATKLGEPVYRKIGFEPEAEYIFLKELSLPTPAHQKIISFTTKYHQAILKIDQRISGESRERILLGHLANAKLIIEGNTISGYYLPTLGEGLVVADTQEAGLALLQQRLMLEHRVVLPSDNKEAVDYLIKNGAKEFLRGTRMRLGEKKQWLPGNIFSRIGGNFG